MTKEKKNGRNKNYSLLEDVIRVIMNSFSLRAMFIEN